MLFIVILGFLISDQHCLYFHSDELGFHMSVGELSIRVTQDELARAKPAV